jgi:uncharacterized protein (AIM24 family)
VAILLVVAWLRTEWARFAEHRALVERTRTLIAAMEHDLAELNSRIEREQVEWQRQTADLVQKLEVERQDIDARLAGAEARWSDALRKYSTLEATTQAARRAADKARINLARLEAESAWWDIVLDQERYAKLQAARIEYATLRTAATQWQRALDSVAPKFKASPVERLRGEKARKAREIEQTIARVSPDIQALLAERNQKQGRIDEARGLMTAQQQQIDRDPRQRLIAAILAALPTALWVLLGVILTPIAIKAFLFFVIAPLTAGLAAIRIDPNPEAIGVPPAESSAVSLAVRLAAGEEMLLHSDFLQSSAQTAPKRTQWFLDARMPFTSVASGMYMLTRIRGQSPDGTLVSVSSQNDPLGEVARIALPAHASLVVQPRSLAAIVRRAETPVRITRHWRLGHLHAWITFQLRYLVFHGPCTLILKGCRGVRAELPDPGHPRIINQSATLGFSANLDYRNTRCETFLAYLRGKESLFNDLFAGGPGCFVYEEMPNAGRRSGITGRGLEGLMDAFLKAFGV